MYVEWMLQICLTLSQFQGSIVSPTLKVIINTVGAQLTLRSFDLCIEAFLGGVCLQHLEFSRELCQLFVLSSLTSFYSASA